MLFPGGNASKEAQHAEGGQVHERARVEQMRAKQIGAEVGDVNSGMLVERFQEEAEEQLPMSDNDL